MDSEVLEKELEQLVSLAEDVSEKVERVEQNRLIVLVCSTIILILTMVLSVYFLRTIIYHYDGFFSMIIVPFFCIFIIIVVWSLTAGRKKLNTEKIVLQDLLDLISTHKELAYREMTVVSKAVFDMRLNRIKFASKSFNIHA